MPTPAQVTSGLDVALLGPTELRIDGRAVPSRGSKLRAVNAQLALARGRAVSVDDLPFGVWGEDLPATARNTLQYQVSVLPKLLAEHGAVSAWSSANPAIHSPRRPTCNASTMRSPRAPGP